MKATSKLNAPLIAGSIILLILLSIILFPSAYTNQNPYATETLKFERHDNGNFRFMTPPFKPDDMHVLGTDEMGRDVVSLILYGARLTIAISVVVVLLRFIISLIAGIAAAFGNPVAQGLIRLSNVIFNFVPPLIICIIVLKIRAFESLPKELSFWVFVSMLTLVGWARIGEVVQSRSEDILKQDFIRGEIAIGKNRGMIALTNVLPHLAAELTVLAFMEIAVVLGLLMQLGAFKVFIGNLRIVEDSQNGIIISKPMSFEPEWAAMMGASKSYLRTAPWLVFAPAVAFFVSILGFNMFGEGLRKVLQAQNSKFLSILKRYTKPVLAAVLIFIIVLGVFNMAPSSTVLAMTQDLPELERVRPGSQEMADWLEQYLADLGFDPVRESYQHPYDFEPYWMVMDAELSGSALETTSETQLVHGVDFSIGGYGQGSYSGTVVDGRMLDVIGFEVPEIKAGDILVIDGRYYTESMILGYIERMDKLVQVEAYIVLSPDVTDRPALGSVRFNAPIVYVDSGISLQYGKYADLTLACDEIQGGGINVYGILEGKPIKNNDEAIIIGMEYNYESMEQRQNLVAGLELAEAFAQISSELDRRVIFAFWDGNYQSEAYGLLDYGRRTIYQPKDTALYLDLSAMSSSGEVIMDESHAPHTRPYAWSLTQRARKMGEDVDLKISNALTKKRPDIFDRGPACIHIQLKESDSGNVSLDEFTGFIYDWIVGGGY